MYAESELPKYPPVFVVRITDSIRRRLTKISRQFTHPNVIMLEQIQNIWILGAISVAADLGLADLLKNGPKTIAELASLTGMLEDPLYRIMRLLASEGIFKERKDKRFYNTPVSESLLEDELKYFVLHTLNKLQFQVSGEMIHSVKTGESTLGLFIKNNAFDHIGQSEELNDLYNKAMTNTSKMQIAAILSVFDFGKFNHIVDIGGGTGLILSTILSKYKEIKGTLFDLPHVVDNSKDLIKDQDILNRLKIIAGTFFETMPEGGDLYMMKNILHCWNDENSIKILQNIRKILPQKGKLLIIETIIKNDNKPSFGKMTDIYMMVGLGGRERTEKEYRILLKRAGFRIEKIIPTVSPLSLIVAIPDWGG